MVLENYLWKLCSKLKKIICATGKTTTVPGLSLATFASFPHLFFGCKKVYKEIVEAAYNRIASTTLGLAHWALESQKLLFPVRPKMHSLEHL